MDRGRNGLHEVRSGSFAGTGEYSRTTPRADAGGRSGGAGGARRENLFHQEAGCPRPGRALHAGGHSAEGHGIGRSEPAESRSFDVGGAAGRVARWRTCGVRDPGRRQGRDDPRAVRHKLHASAAGTVSSGAIFERGDSARQERTVLFEVYRRGLPRLPSFDRGGVGKRSGNLRQRHAGGRFRKL